MGTALIPTDAPATAARKPLDIQLDRPNAANIFTTLDIQNDRDKATLVRAMAQPDERVEAFIGMDISIVGLVAQVVALTDDKTGEEVEAPRIALLLEDGTTAGATSVGVLNSCKTLTALYGLPTQDNPWVVTVRQVATRRGYRTFELLPVVPGEAKGKANARGSRAK